jgi:error-prone DNA polymerase
VGGIVISDRVLTDYVPLQQSTKGIVICQYDKDDVEELGLVKLDLLGLRIHSAIERCLDLVEREHGTRPDIDHVPLDDPATYRLMQEARTVGCFQLESPGERSLQVRLLPANFTDVIANISLFRPGPVQADMITPFIERRHGREPVTLAHPRLEPILGETYGVITYQEQVLLVAHAIAGFSLAEADSLRRAMTREMSQEEFGGIRRRFLEGATANGVSREDAESTFHQIAGFASYGFCKGHAACFGLIAYQTAYLKAHHSAAFLAGVLSNEPMGFYPARTIVEDAKRLGIAVLRPDVNASEVQYSVKDGAIRIGLLQVVGLAERDQEAIVRERECNGPYTSFVDFHRRLRIDRDGLENLVLCGAFDTIPFSPGDPEPEWVELPSGTTEAHPGTCVRRDAIEHRRGLLWNMPMVMGADPQWHRRPCLCLPERTGTEAGATASRGLQPAVNQPLLALERELLLLDYQTLHLSPLRHPVALVRERLEREGCSRSLDLLGVKSGKRVKVAGVVVSRNRPPVKSGRTVVFITLEDEVGLLDAVVFEETYHKWRNVLFGSDTLIVEGKLDRPGGTTISVIVNRAEPLNPLGASTPRTPTLTPGPGDHSHVKLQHLHTHAGPRKPQVAAGRA